MERCKDHSFNCLTGTLLRISSSCSGLSFFKSGLSVVVAAAGLTERITQNQRACKAGSDRFIGNQKTGRGQRLVGRNADTGRPGSEITAGAVAAGLAYGKRDFFSVTKPFLTS
jgi:hypothetical protein